MGFGHWETVSVGLRGDHFWIRCAGCCTLVMDMVCGISVTMI